MMLPADPKASYQAHAAEIHAAIERVLASGQYILGPEVDAFEKEFAAYCGSPNCITVANGTEALEIALRALELPAGSRVATVANTVTATVSAIEQSGASPVLVDVNPATMVMDPASLEGAFAKWGSNLKAVIPVHLYGHPAPMPELLALADAHGAQVIEDCAQAHGASLEGRRVGGWGALAAFSFYPTKNLGAIGDGGAITVRDPRLADRVRLVRQYGWRTRYVAEIAGRNSRLDELQAAILRVKLRSLEAENADRRRLASRYLERLAGTPLQLPGVAAGAVHVYHQFVVRTPRREALRAHLHGKGIACGILYPTPIHHQPAYRDSNLSLPQAERACAEVLCLPCHPGLSVTDVDRVCDEIVGWSRLS